MKFKILASVALLFVGRCFAVNQESAESRLLIKSNCVAQEMIQLLPIDDRESLELLFATFVNSDQFGYTLFSEKPIALGGGFVKTSYENVLAGYRSGCFFWRRWELWKLHFGKVKFRNFLFIEENFAACPEIRFVFLINKTLFVKTIRDHATRFHNITGREVDPMQLLSDLELGRTTLQQALSYSEELLGILLGFGEHNAALYAKRQKLEGPLLIPLAFEKEPSIGFISVKDEVDSIYELLQSPYDEDLEAYVINPVMFAADRAHPETSHLCRKYLKARAKLCKLYRNQSYLEVSLKQLIFDQSMAGEACCD